MNGRRATARPLAWLLEPRARRGRRLVLFRARDREVAGNVSAITIPTSADLAAGGGPAAGSTPPPYTEAGGDVPLVPDRLRATDVLSGLCGGRRSVVAVGGGLHHAARGAQAAVNTATFALARDPPQGERRFDDAS